MSMMCPASLSEHFMEETLFLNCFFLLPLEVCAGQFFSAAAEIFFQTIGGSVNRLKIFFRRLRRRMLNFLSAAAAYLGANIGVQRKNISCFQHKTGKNLKKIRS